MSVHAPYNFVPLSKTIVVPDWAHQVSHDLPFRDGISGTIEVEMRATTPICVGSGVTTEQQVDLPFQLPDGTYAIPGSSVKGMLRNVLEIATFSKISLVERNRRFAVRDLSRGGRFYRDQLTQEGARGVYATKVKSGWLHRDDNGDWWITPCKFSRVEQSDLLDLLGDEERTKLENCFTGRVSAKQKYRVWGEDNLELPFTPGPRKKHGMSKGGHLIFSLATDLGRGQTRGTLVFTGQPSPNQRLRRPRQNRGKHREFVFYGNESSPLKVDPSVMRDFQLNHSKEQGERHAGGDPEPNEEWGYWKRQLNQGRRVPVFYLEKNGEVDSLGLAQMYRLAYKLSVGDAIDNSSPDHAPAPDRLDMADLIFGQVAAENEGSGLKGRATITTFRAVGTPQLTTTITGILNSPKPTYYPTYIEQTSHSEYRTFMDTDARIRGWKRYPVRTDEIVPPRPDRNQQNVASHWRCLERGTIFRGRIVVHNLKPEELGALLWTLDFGGNSNLRHALGKAKPFGFGALHLSVLDMDLMSVADFKPVTDIASIRQAFSTFMEGHIPNWSQSEQIANLLAMADPEQGTRHSNALRYMRLGAKNENEFVAAKKGGYYLPPYLNVDEARQYKVAQRGHANRPNTGPNRSRTIKQTSHSSGIKPNDVVYAVLLEEKSRKGKWKAQVGSLKGVIQNAEGLPENAQPGDKVRLVVAFANDKEIGFRGVKK